MTEDGVGKTCLKCGHTRTAADSGPAYACPKCAAVYAKVEAAQRAREAAAAAAPANPYAPPGAPVAPAASQPAWGSEVATNRAREGDYGVMAHVVYLLYVLPVGFTMIVGLIVAYVMRGRAGGTWVGSHFDWQISTFWRAFIASLVFYGIALVLFFVLGLGARRGVGASHWVGYVVVLLGGVVLIGLWCLYRIVKGWYRLVQHDAVA